MRISRRQVLKNASLASGGLAVAPALLPFMQQAKAAAADAAVLPKRVVFVVKSSGLTPAQLVPQGKYGELVDVGKATKPGDNYRQAEKLRSADHLIDFSLADHDLAPTLQPLEPFKDKLTIVQGLSGKMCQGGHTCSYGALGCYRVGSDSGGGRPLWATIDGEMAKAMPGIFPHVGLSLGSRIMGTGVANSVVYPGISSMGKDRPLPFQANPLMAYNDLFAVAATGKDAKTDNALKANLLDFMMDDIKQLDRKTAGAEKQKLDRYLEAFESLRERDRKLKGVEAEIRKHAPEVTDKFKSNVETDRLEAHFDIATAALIAGLTNVVTLRVDTLGVVYSGLGIDRGVHGIGHGESVVGMTVEQARGRIRQFHIEQIAQMAASLKAVPEGDGTMLDNTLIVYLSDAAEKHHATCVEWPFLMVGGLGDELNKTGRYIQYPGYGRPGHRTIANLYLTFLHAVGQPRDEFGQIDLNLDKASQQGPLGELLA